MMDDRRAKEKRTKLWRLRNDRNRFGALNKYGIVLSGEVYNIIEFIPKAIKKWTVHLLFGWCVFFALLFSVRLTDLFV